MSDKKHIDRIFQEKLKDLEVTPNPKVWENIQSKLEQPKQDKEKVFPIWLRIASVAALLLALLTIGNLFNSNNTTNINVVDTENASETENNNANNTLAEESNNTSKSEEIIVETKNTSEENKSKLNTGIATSNTSEAKTNKKSSSINNSIYNKSQNNNKLNSITGSKNSVTTNKQTPLVSTNNNTSEYSNSKSERVASNNKESINQNVVSNKKTNNNTLNTTNSKSERLTQNNTENRSNNTGNVTELDKNKVDFELKNNTTNAVTENQTNTEEENTTTDVETKKEETSIEEEIAKAEDLIEKEEDKKVNRWQVYANIAPVYYNTLSKGSHIDEQFNNNSKSGEINTSYGVNVSYAFNEKLKVRSGINSLNLSYDTDNVIIYENVSGGNAPALKNIDFNSNEQTISAISANNLVAQQAVGLLPNENAAISQRLGYYEVPVELEYTISNKKFGVNVIAGLSTFILNDNKIYSEFEGRKTEIGEANNINDVSFSGNVGLGLDYKFSDKIKLNVQPTFKYQINAYENTSGDFRPYIVGVYTGLSYKF